MTTRRCFYEVLSVERDADASAIKVAYRKAALKWHPDKNPDNPEAHSMFQEITNAYTTLSDPQERAWYDGHREAILRGGDGTAEEGEAQHGINLWPYFSSSCYSGYSDNERGFYVVYSKVFTALAEEEMEAAATKKSDKVPSFGDADTSYDQVRHFYQYWTSFSSHKTFAWCDQYNTTTAENRRIRKLMEKDNNKARAKAKKAYNDQIRHLVEIVKKRDRRVIEYMVKLKKEQEDAERAAVELKKIQEVDRQKAMARLRQEQERAYQELEAELEARQEEEGFQSPFHVDEQDDEEAKEGVYCAACKKLFKSDRQWKNHERSKKHQVAAAALAEELMAMDAEAGETDEGQGDEDYGGEGESDILDEEDDEAGNGEDEVNESENGEIENVEQEDEEPTDDIEVNDEENDEGEGNVEEDDADENYEYDETGEEDAEDAVQENEESIDEGTTQNEYNTADETEDATNVNESSQTDKQHTEDDDAPAEVLDTEAELGKQAPTKRAGTKKQQRRAAKRAAAAAQSVPATSVPVEKRWSKENRSKLNDEPVPQVSLACGVCSTMFTSRNALFAHIKEMDHALPLGATKRKKKRDKRRMWEE